MPSTHTSLEYHLVFATKRREPLIAPDWRLRLHEYLGGAARGPTTRARRGARLGPIGVSPLFLPNFS